jgi:hypothetical protein
MSESQSPFPKWFKVRNCNFPQNFAEILSKFHEGLRMMCEKIQKTVKPMRADYFNRMLEEYSKLLACLARTPAQCEMFEQVYESISITMEMMFGYLKCLKQLILDIYRSKINKCFWTDQCVFDTYAKLVTNIIDMRTKLSNFKPIGSVGIE